jgi:hypothetical protein
MSVLDMYSPYFHFLEKKLRRCADPLWGLVQLHFWRMLGQAVIDRRPKRRTM